MLPQAQVMNGASPACSDGQVRWIPGIIRQAIKTIARISYKLWDYYPGFGIPHATPYRYSNDIRRIHERYSQDTETIYKGYTNDTERIQPGYRKDTENMRFEIRRDQEGS